MLDTLIFTAVIAGAFFLLKAIWNYEMKVAKSE